MFSSSDDDEYFDFTPSVDQAFDGTVTDKDPKGLNMVSFMHMDDSVTDRDEQIRLMEEHSRGVKHIVMDTIVQERGGRPVTIVNVVSTYSIGCRLNSVKIALVRKDVIPLKFNIAGFSAMIIPILCHGIAHTTVLVYPSSCVVHTGAKDEYHSRLAAWLFVDFFRRRLSIPMSVFSFKIGNIVSNLDVGHGVDLPGLKDDLGVTASYEPADIQCVIYRDPQDRRHVTLVYSSGSAVITGSKKRSEIFDQYRTIMDKVRHHKLDDTTSMLEHRHGHKQKMPGNKKARREFKYGKRGGEKDCYLPMDPFLSIGLVPTSPTKPPSSTPPPTTTTTTSSGLNKRRRDVDDDDDSSSNSLVPTQSLFT